MPRVKYATVLRCLVILGLFCLWVQILLSASNDLLDKDGEELMNVNETSEQVLALVPPEFHKYLTVHSRNASGNATDRFAPKNITEILKLIHKYNDAQTIYNEDIFGPVQNDTLIIAIQVHTRLAYLRHLIVSLAQAKDIDNTLLVFSHDYYDEEVNALVRSIDFTKVMQIFYPYSIQTHPNEFPGVDPNDCPRDAKAEQAMKLKCNNALHPDVHGHYREAKYTQTKHHWWWKANRIFNQLQCTAGHTGMVLFLEEDHYVAEDFIHMMNLLRSTADKSCPQCEILCLGTYLKTYQYHLTSDKLRKKQLTLSYIQQVRVKAEERRKKNQDAWNFQVYPHLYGTTQKSSNEHVRYGQSAGRGRVSLPNECMAVRERYPPPACRPPRTIALSRRVRWTTVEITPWYSSMHNMGFAINRTVWNNIMELTGLFCEYDDYNWDYSLLHLSQNRPNKPKFKVMLCKGPRVFHIGECGFHHKKKNCNPSIVISKVQKLMSKYRKFMFPSRLTASVNNGGAKHNKRLVKGNGGWGDLRDQELCTNMTKVGRQMKRLYEST